MKNSKFIAIIIGMLIMLGSCVKPEDPTNVQILKGEWEVVSVIANGVVNPDETFAEESVLHLDRNETYLFVTVDGRAEAGTWDADEETLTLTSSDGGAKVFNIVYLDYNKMHVYYSFNNDLTGDIELRYLFERN
jgi:hypothetical protein